MAEASFEYASGRHRVTAEPNGVVYFDVWEPYLTPVSPEGA